MKREKKAPRLRLLLKERSAELYNRYQSLWKFALSEYLYFLNVDNYTDHGKKHVEVIERNIGGLLVDPALKKLSSFELFCLLAACCLHDIGMIDRKKHDEPVSIIRMEHHVRVKKLLKKKFREFQLNEHEAFAIGEICYGHGISNLDDLELQEWSVHPHGKVDIRFLTALLRIGDLLDLSFLRAPTLVAELRKIKGVSLRHWSLHSKISDIEVNHKQKEITVFANAEDEHDLSELFRLRNWINDELKLVKEVFTRNGIYLDKVSLHTKFENKRVVLSKENPFIKLDSFDWEQHVAFFGRKKEIDDISRIVMDREIVILVGESGVGKTSLLKAGLKQKLIEEGIYVFESRVTNNFDRELLGRLGDQFPKVTKKKLPNALKEISEEGFEVALFVDQFEELFTLYENENDRLVFIRFIKALLGDKAITAKLILSVREDFLAELWEMSKYFPELYDRRNTYRLKKPSRENAKQIIINTVNHINYSIDDDLVEKLLDDFTKREESIYPPYIQIVCFEIFKKHKVIYKDNSYKIPIQMPVYESLEDVEKIISDYFEEILDGFNLTDRMVINEIMARMVTFFYTKQRISYEQILEINSDRIDIDKTLNRLINHRIIKKIETELSNEYELIHDFLAKKIMENKSPKGLSSNIKKAFEYIEDNFHNQFSLQEIANHLMVSREHFCRLFKFETSINFVDYLNKRRVEEVEKYLKREPSLKLKDICSTVGFSSPQHFTKTFKKVTGISPTEYRRKVINGEI